MTDAEITIGEIYRLLVSTTARIEALAIVTEQQHHRLRADMIPLVKSITTLETEMLGVTADMTALGKDVKALNQRSWLIAGGAAAVAWLINMLGFGKHQ